MRSYIVCRKGPWDGERICVLRGDRFLPERIHMNTGSYVIKETVVDNKAHETRHYYDYKPGSDHA